MANRQIVYPGAIPLDTDILSIQRNMMIALGYLAQATLGTTTVADGLACTQQAVPNMTVQIAPGSIISLQTVDATAFGSLAADTTDPLLKMGINQSIVQSSTLGTISAPTTSGQSINYLISASFQEADGTSVVLPYYNSANPAQPYSGPANAGTAQNTVRAQTVNLALTAGTAATTGSQTTPSVPSGSIGLWVITVAYGATSIVNANITAYATNSLVRFKLPLVSTPTNAHGQCRLSVVSSTSLMLSPYQGAGLQINGTPQTVPQAGVTISNSGLSASTKYYVYAYMNGSTMALALSTTTHATNTDGVEIMSGNAAYTLVGMIYTAGGSTFSDTGAYRGCANWFNRRPRSLQGPNTGGTGATSTAYTELWTGARIYFLAWSDSAVELAIGGQAQNNASGNSTATGIGLDGAIAGVAGGGTSTSASSSTAQSACYAGELSEGNHLASPYGAIANTGTGTFSVAIYGTTQI